ncbi:MAG TPA: DNA polymerase III subunit alpha, partial [Bacteroidia bacterium]|nr:DNA polymerase III subunit alpha [Bacteroidia bacterium]
MFLIFDTETTGLPRNYNAPLTDSDNWPRMVQIAWQLHDDKGTLLHHDSIIIKPEGYTIPFNAEQIHGISTKRALEEGKDLKTTLQDFIEVVNQCQYLCGHNIEFDINIIGAEFLRMNLPNVFESKKSIDTKNDQTTEFCAIPGGKGGKFKWPTLTELYTKLFNEKFAEAHNAAFDVQATTKVFFEILKRGITKVNEVSDVSIIKYQSPDLSELLSNELKLKEEKTKTETTLNTQVSIPTTQYSNLNFSHLHNHSQYSVLQCTSEVSGLVKKAAEFNMSGVALTDHGNMYGAFAFWEAVYKHNKSVKSFNASIESGEKQGEPKKELKCILGCELYVNTNHLDKTKQDNGFAIPFLIKTKKGYENLSKLSSIGFTEGFYYVPRIDKDVLVKYKEGLIVTTGGLMGEVPSLILNVGEQQAEEAFLWWKEQFGEDFYVELNRHNLPDENHVNEVLLRFAEKHDVKYIAANNNYYLDKKGSDAHDILLCVKDGELKETPVGRGRGFRYGMPNNEFYFRSPKEMSDLFQDLPEALENTNEIVNKIEDFKLGRDVLLPKFQIPTEFLDERDKDPADEGKGNRGENAYLKYLSFEGAKKRYPDMSPEIKERLDFELSVMERMGYPGYFLIVSDFTTKAREMGVSVGPGRGSAAGSAVAYCLGITNVDPIKYDLLFERFLNPDRISMPDIDIDFDDEGRDRVIDYVIQKYGFNQVAQIITYGTMGGKSAIRDTARVLNLPLPDADRLAKSFPDSLEADLYSLLKPGGIDEKYLDKIKDRREVIEQSNNFRKLALGDGPEAKVLRQAYELEGSLRNTGIHACGVIITPDE